MKKFSLELLKSYQRPIVKLYGLNTLIDTGAVIPTFSLPVQILQKRFNAKLILENAQIGGFEGLSNGKIYSLENFKVGDFLFEELEVFVPNKAVTAHPFLLSATMFFGTEYTFDTINSMFSVYVPDDFSLNRKFHIKDLDGKLYVQIDGNVIPANI